jgi:hypothetical protein
MPPNAGVNETSFMHASRRDAVFFAFFLLQENTVNGEHLWVDTSVSGDFCYVGETECTVSGRGHVKSRSARKSNTDFVETNEQKK